jgi:hypothetical protein
MGDLLASYNFVGVAHNLRAVAASARGARPPLVSSGPCIAAAGRPS